MKKQLLIVAVAVMAISAISSCAKCQTCVNPSKTEKVKYCETDDNTGLNDFVASQEADGWKCHSGTSSI